MELRDTVHVSRPGRNIITVCPLKKEFVQNSSGGVRLNSRIKVKVNIICLTLGFKTRS